MPIKPTQIRRGIQSRNLRTTGEAPQIGRVARLRNPKQWQDAAGVGSASGGHDPAVVASRRRALVAWSLILTFTTLLVIGGCMVFWLFGRGNQALVADATPALPAARCVRKVSRFVAPTEQESLALVQRAFANHDPSKVESLFHCGAASVAEVMAFLGDGTARDGLIKNYVWLSSMDLEDLQIEGVMVTYAGQDTDDRSDRLALLTPDDQGTWKIDFEAFARCSRPAWKELLDGRVVQAQVRVIIARDNYFNGPFRNDRHWSCYGMGSPESKKLLPDGQDLLHGYCLIGSSQAKALEQLFTNDERSNQRDQKKRVTLEISKIKGAEARQFEITRVLAADWVLTPKAFDEKFE